MILFGEGLMTGLMLTVMLGPVTMVILKNGLEINRMAGVWAAAGTWVSDFVFISLTFWMTASIEQWSLQSDNKFTIYSAGGTGLFLMGMVMARVKRKQNGIQDLREVSGYSRAFISGFLVNSLSPFTLFFWLGAAVFLHLQAEPPIYYYAGLMLTLGIGDFLKAWLAPKLTTWLKEKHVYWVQVVAGVLIAVTGLYIIFLGVNEYFSR
jgi:threonine/homoserine/homoserine lactone efflux protein